MVGMVVGGALGIVVAGLLASARDEPVSHT